jgi:hypothetical protein
MSYSWSQKLFSFSYLRRLESSWQPLLEDTSNNKW